MQISNQFALSGVDAVKGSLKGAPAAKSEAVESTSQLNPVDQLDLSAEAQGLLGAEASSSSRLDRIAQIRAEIANGSYDTDEKLSVALERMLDQIG